MCPLPEYKSTNSLKMVYTDCVFASHMRVEVNINFVWKFLAKHYKYEYYIQLNVKRIVEKFEDYLNSVDLIAVSVLQVHSYLRKLIAESYKCEMT